MIILAWMNRKIATVIHTDPVSLPRLFTVANAKDEMVVIKDRTDDLLLTIGGRRADDELRPRAQLEAAAANGSLKMLVVRTEGEVESALRMDNGVVTALLGAPLPTGRLSGVLLQLDSMIGSLGVAESDESGQAMDLARIMKSMEDIGEILELEEANNGSSAKPN